jgi:hypothetical protein
MHKSHDTQARTRAETHKDMQNHHTGHSIVSLLRKVTVFQPLQCPCNLLLYAQN